MTNTEREGFFTFSEWRGKNGGSLFYTKVYSKVVFMKKHENYAKHCKT